MWFNIAELQLTTLLAVVLKQRDFPKFDLLAQGMDARVKCERLRRACKRYCPMGERFKAGLRYFEDNSVPLRNKLSHSWPICFDPADDPLVHLATIGHWLPRSPIKGDPAQSIHIDDLLREALWLNDYANVVLKATDALIDGKPLEIADPNFRLPKEAL